MEDLEDLRLHENEMDGIIPDSLYTIPKLKKLWLQDTLKCEELQGGGYDCTSDSSFGFKGTISKEIGNLKKLQTLLVNSNPLSGTLPTEIGLCEDLGEFRSMRHRHRVLPFPYRLQTHLCQRILSPSAHVVISGSHSAHTQNQRRGVGSHRIVPSPRQEPEQRLESGGLVRRLQAQQQDQGSFLCLRLLLRLL